MNTTIPDLLREITEMWRSLTASSADIEGVLWLLLTWVALAAAVMVIHFMLRRARRLPGLPADVGHFLPVLERAVRNRSPHVRWCGLSEAGDQVVLAVDGQETPVPVGPLLAHYRAFPDALPALVANLIVEIKANALNTPADHWFGDVFPSILPQIRSRTWLAGQSTGFGDAALVHRELSDDLVVCYVIDDADTVVFICRAHLRRWQKSEQDLFHLACRNLRQLAGTPDVPEPSVGMLVHRRDGYDAARLLLLDRQRTEGLLVAIPDRDAMWVGTISEDALPSLMKSVESRSLSATHPISRQIYRMHNGVPVAITPSST